MRGSPARGPAVVLAALFAAWLVAGCGPSGGGGPGSTTGPSLGTGHPPVPSTFPVGSWTTSITREDLRAGGLTGDLIDQNEGSFVLTYRPDGTWQTVQTSRIGVVLREPVLRGWYGATVDRVEHHIEFPAHYLDEGVWDIVGWRLEGGLLHLQLLDRGDPIAKVIYGTHPWQRA